jgi:LuxR family transcriptional regulator, quorum-sensing system regulator SdiA
MIECLVFDKLEIPPHQYVPPFLEPLVQAAKRGDDLVPYVRSLVTSLGFDHFTYGASNTLHPDKNGMTYAYWTAPDEWMQAYASKGFIEVDPRVFLTCKSAIPLIWDQTNVRGIGQNVDVFVDTAKRFGICSGVSFMLHGPYDGHAAVIFDSHVERNDEIRMRLIARNLPDLHMFGCYWHELFMMPVIRQRREHARRASMSGRERECLQLAANGLTTKDIATRLGISARTVQFHFGRLCGKLNAANRQEAIAVAVRERLLTTGAEVEPNPSLLGQLGPVPSPLTHSPPATRAAPSPSARSRAA